MSNKENGVVLEQPKGEKKTAKVTIEILDDAPLTLSRPLALIDGRSYAATWPYVLTTDTETGRQEKERGLLVVRNDGVTFGDAGDEPLKHLELEVKLSDIPPSEKLWSRTTVKAYCCGFRQDPQHVITRLVDVIDRFIDFDKSLADQRTMAEFVACYILATWFLDAFNVIGFLWPNGEKGSGKTQLLTLKETFR